MIKLSISHVHILSHTFVVLWFEVWNYCICHVVVKIQFASATYSGSESSHEIIVSIVALGTTSTKDINVTVSLTEGTAKS